MGARAAVGAGDGAECCGSSASGRFTARRLTTVGRMRSSTVFWEEPFSWCRLMRSTTSGDTALMWLRTSDTPSDCNRATNALLSMPKSRATSYTRSLVLIKPP